jgi:thioredoxin reductase
VEIEKAERLPNLEKHEGYKVVEIEGEDTLSSLCIRKRAGDETLDLPVMGVFVAIGLKPNSALVDHLAEINPVPASFPPVTLRTASASES